jgi:V/A-type H+-transporting ATPase subunit I
MKKAAILTLEKDITASLERLRALGVLHIEKKEVASAELEARLEEKARIEKAKQILMNFAPKKKEEVADGASDPGEIPADPAGAILSLAESRKQKEEEIAKNAREMARIAPWGDFDPETLADIEKTTGPLYLYELSDKTYGNLPEDARVIVLKKVKSRVFLVVPGTPLENETPFAVPKESLGTLSARNEALSSEIADIGAGLTEKARLLPYLDTLLKEAERAVEYETAKAGREAVTAKDEGVIPISLLSGWIPEPLLGEVSQCAKEQGWALSVSDPGEGDRPPTLTKNNKAVEIIKPLFGFIGTVPGYSEYDISPSFLLFFSVFFAMIFGDAAYGVILLAATLAGGLLAKKKSGKFPDAAKLFTLLASTTIIWGAVNGSWFAAPYGSLPGVLQALVIPQFREGGPLFLRFFSGLMGLAPGYTPSDAAQWNVQFFCFSLGIVQLVYSHIKNIKRLVKGGSTLVALSQAGWLIMMLGLYFLVLSMLLKVRQPGFTVPLILAGIIIYFIFANQTGGNFLVNIGKSFANFLPTFLNAVGSFADIISYIRLFAVGLAGTKIAQSFNAMSGIGAVSAGGPSVGTFILRLAGAIFILAFGHGLNMMMNALSVIVHGVRLNLLEYAGNHLGMEWSGYAYKPFGGGARQEQ